MYLLCSCSVFSQEPNSVRFLSYNLKNYLWMKRQGELRPKPEEEVSALVDIITGANPDIIGISEIGTEKDLKDLQHRLRAKGLNLPYFSHASGSDPVRKLGILSRYEITEDTKSPLSDLSYNIQGRTEYIRRGILDVKILTPLGSIHTLGIHLKSKRPIPEYDQALVRRNEAHLLRKRISKILKNDPESNLLVYGDFNDTKASTTIHYIKSDIGSTERLSALSLADNSGYYWTQYWKAEDIYSRFDWAFINKAMRPLVDREQSKIISHPQWYTASDHRPLLIVFRKSK